MLTQAMKKKVNMLVSNVDLTILQIPNTLWHLIYAPISYYNLNIFLTIHINLYQETTPMREVQLKMPMKTSRGVSLALEALLFGDSSRQAVKCVGQILKVIETLRGHCPANCCITKLMAK